MNVSRVILHFDMNSYFASVEQQANPALRGRPVGIVATLAPGACLIATSKEAKAEGIVTGQSVRDGLAIDPGLRVLEVDPSKYRSTTERIFKIVSQYSEAVELYSIDEAFVDLTGRARSLAAGAALARELQQRIKSEVGEWLTCSAGVAPTRWLAKFASDTAPKAGVVTLDPNQLDRYLAGRSLTDAWGIADRLAIRLGQLGLTTLIELKRYPVINLIQHLGVKGYELWATLNGVEMSGVQSAEVQPKSVSHSHVLRVRTKSSRFQRAVLMKLCEKTGQRLRELKLEARSVWVGAHYLSDQSISRRGSAGWGGHQRLGIGLSSSRLLYRIAWSILEPGLSGRVATFLVVGASELRPAGRQLDLWPQPRASNVEAALDELRRQFGQSSIIWGSMWAVESQAPDRIGFRKTIDRGQAWAGLEIR